MRKMILASKSPRRRELLEKAGYEFEIIVSSCEEIISSEKPDEIVLELSGQKAEDVLAITLDKYGNNYIEEYMVIGADTIVVMGDEILGKPKDEADAVRMLSMLQGKSHYVYTGVTIAYMDKGSVKKHSFCECTEVTFYPMSMEDIKAYVANDSLPGETRGMADSVSVSYPWQDKAGGYGIQEPFGARFVKKINGDYNNVVGLPISRLYQELKSISL